MSSSLHSKEDKEAVLGEERKLESVCVPPAVAQNHLISEEKPQAPLPPLQALFSENSNPKPLVIWGQGNKVQEVQHQKQTSCQLLGFIKAKTKNKDALDFTVFGRTEGRNEVNNSETSSSVLATSRPQRNQLPTDNRINALASKTLLANDANSTSVFNIKSVNSSGNVTYSCMVMTETELWDDGKISTEILQSNTLHNTSEYYDLQYPISQATNSSENMNGDPQNLQARECKEDDSSANSQTQTPNNLSIPDFEIRLFEEAEVVVSHIRSPSVFYIQRADLHEKLQALVPDSCETSPSYAEQNFIPDIGTLAMAWFSEKDQWFRAQVTNICEVILDDVPREAVGTKSSIQVDVKRLDYGDTCCLSLWNLKALPAEGATLPLQALQVSLANVMPINGIEWSDEAVGWFKTITHNRMFFARFYPQKPTVTVELFLEKGKMGAMRRGAPLSMRLAQNGLARHTKVPYIDFLRKRDVEVKARKQLSDWEKHLISCYIPPKK